LRFNGNASCTDLHFVVAILSNGFLIKVIKLLTRAAINPVIGVILAVIPVIAAMLWYIWDKRRNKQRHAKLIENWEANLLIFELEHLNAFKIWQLLNLG